MINSKITIVDKYVGANDFQEGIRRLAHKDYQLSSWKMSIHPKGSVVIVAVFVQGFKD